MTRKKKVFKDLTCSYSLPSSSSFLLISLCIQPNIFFWLTNKNQFYPSKFLFCFFCWRANNGKEMKKLEQIIIIRANGTKQNKNTTTNDHEERLVWLMVAASDHQNHNANGSTKKWTNKRKEKKLNVTWRVWRITPNNEPEMNKRIRWTFGKSENFKTEH